MINYKKTWDYSTECSHFHTRVMIQTSDMKFCNNLISINANVHSISFLSYKLGNVSLANLNHTFSNVT